jgi:hypothetical protein
MSKHFILIEVEELPHQAANIVWLASAVQSLLVATGIQTCTAQAISEDELEARFIKEPESDDSKPKPKPKPKANLDHSQYDDEVPRRGRRRSLDDEDEDMDEDEISMHERSVYEILKPISDRKNSNEFLIYPKDGFLQVLNNIVYLVNGSGQPYKTGIVKARLQMLLRSGSIRVKQT